jgi:hypothetical protein
VITADVAVVPAAGAAEAAPRARRLSAEAAALWQKFPPRAVAASWPATQAGRGTVVSEAMTCPYAAAENDQSRYSRRLGVLRMLDWLETQPGATWQERWHAGCRAAAGQDWRDVAERWLKDTGRIADGNRAVWQSLGGALGLLIGRDVIRPDLGWLLASATPAHLAADMARVRDPAGFAALEEAAGPSSVSVSSTLLFWKDLETHHPGIGSLNLAPDVAVAWKQRMQSRTVKTTGPGGERTQARVPRLSVVDHLAIVRSFYLDIAEWAATDPSRWAQWAAPCPVRPGDPYPPAGAQAPQVTHGPADPRTPARTAPPDRRRGKGTRQRRVPAGGGSGRRARPGVHRRRPDAGTRHPERSQPEDLGRRPRHRETAEPD